MAQTAVRTRKKTTAKAKPKKTVTPRRKQSALKAVAAPSAAQVAVATPGSVLPAVDVHDSLEQFDRDGFLILEKYLSDDLIEKINAEARHFYEKQGAHINNVGRTMNMHRESPTIQQVLHDPNLFKLLGTLLKAEPYFLQSIYFFRGSQQPLHTDYLYMSTEPHLQLCGIWFALEDVDLDNGPLMYVPGSHKLPIASVKDRYDTHFKMISDYVEKHREELEIQYRDRISVTNESLESCVFFDRWLDEINNNWKSAGMEVKWFQPKKGDVLVWHANLMHGGDMIRDHNRTRKSFVAHYLTQAVETYYDMNYPDKKNPMKLSEIDVNRPAVLQIHNR
ncbi:MAG: phytanoyl-CoA dioxygenase family protein [Hyphomicrobiales bacterium]|nr:phytanoyl-CoA dioxygenase family protein [Hyphomicrobiales bacterium]